jgi:hypothetical protein
MILNNKLFYLSNSQYGGWVSFSYHLAKIFNENHVIKVKETFKGGGQFYGDIQYKNIKKTAIHNFKNPIILAVDKAHYELLKHFNNATIVIHDPTELSPEVIEFAKRNQVVTIRETVHKLLNKMGIENNFLKHPFYKYPKYNLDKKYNRSLSRVDFDKNTDIICKANNLGADIEIYGYKNHIYYFHKLKELGFDKYYKGYYSKNLNDISKLYSETRYLIDMSTIKNDGGGTQYTFLEAEYHDCGLILHKNWCNVSNSVYKHGENCYAVSNEKELIDALKQKRKVSNLIPTDKENDLWKKILI